MITQPSSPSLSEAIDQLIGLGHRDPREGCDLLVHQHGKDWLLAAAAPHLPDWIADMIRQQINAERRQQVARITPAGLMTPEIKLMFMWVPHPDGYGSYVRLADATAEDFDRRAVYLERLSLAVLRQAAWCRDVAELLRSRKLGVAGELETLPPLPAADGLALPEAA